MNLENIQVNLFHFANLMFGYSSLPFYSIYSFVRQYPLFKIEYAYIFLVDKNIYILTHRRILNTIKKTQKVKFAKKHTIL